MLTNMSTTAVAAAHPDPDGAGQLAELVEVLGEIDRLAARACRLAAQVDGRAAVAEEGMPVETALQLHTGWTRTDVRTLLTAADTLASMPAAADLFDRGVFSWGHIRALTAGVRPLDPAARAELDGQLDRRGDQLGRLEGERRLWALDDAIADHAPTASLERATDRHGAGDGDRLVLTPRLDGSGQGWFDYDDPEAFQTVAGRLDAEADTPRAAPCPTDGSSSAAPADRPTSRAQQLAAALLRLCSRTGTDGPASAARGVVVLDVDEVTDRFAGTLQATVAGRSPRLVRRALERLTCDADLDVVLRHGTDLLAAKRYQPSVPEATRRAIATRDGGCRFPACTAPVSWCDVHHVLEQSRHLDHHPTNLLLLCRRHHTIVHRRGWRQILRPDGAYTLRRRGRTWTTLPRHGPTRDRATRDGPRPRDGPSPGDGPEPGSGAARDGPLPRHDPEPGSGATGDGPASGLLDDAWAPSTPDRLGPQGPCPF